MVGVVDNRLVGMTLRCVEDWGQRQLLGKGKWDWRKKQPQGASNKDSSNEMAKGQDSHWVIESFPDQ